MSRMRGILVGAVLLLAATNAWAQATAQINGTVSDSSGAVLPGVTVVAIQTDTGFRRETVSDQDGAYAVVPTKGRRFFLAQPQLMLDMGKLSRLTDGHLYAGIEYQIALNRYLQNNVNENVAQLLFKWKI